MNKGKILDIKWYKINIEMICKDFFVNLGGGTNSKVAASSNTPSNQVCYSSDGDSDEE